MRRSRGSAYAKADVTELTPSAGVLPSATCTASTPTPGAAHPSSFCLVRSLTKLARAAAYPLTPPPPPWPACTTASRGPLHISVRCCMFLSLRAGAECGLALQLEAPQVSASKRAFKFANSSRLSRLRSSSCFRSMSSWTRSGPPVRWRFGLCSSLAGGGALATAQSSFQCFS